VDAVDKKHGSIWVHRYRIIGTPRWIYEAWEPAGRFPHYGYQTLSFSMFPGGGVMGLIGSRDLPPEIDAVPVGPARWEAIAGWRKSEAARAHEAILAAFPGAAAGTRDGARIEVWEAAS
jgi:hypothetical protein